jgi:hypothetical protein
MKFFATSRLCSLLVQKILQKKKGRLRGGPASPNNILGEGEGERGGVIAPSSIGHLFTQTQTQTLQISLSLVQKEEDGKQRHERKKVICFIDLDLEEMNYTL